MRHVTTIEINEIETEVLIDFNTYFGQVVINKITDLATGDAIVPDLVDENLSDKIHNELHEVAADYNAVKEYTKFNYEF